MEFRHPFTCIVAGPTKAGKTTFVKQLLKNSEKFINPPPKQIWWFFSEEQDFQKEFENVNFLKGLPDLSLIRAHSNEPQLVIIDDLMQEANGDVVSLFTRGCHHWNLSVVHIVQNIFYKGLRTSRINAEYLVLMKNPADKLQINTLAHQLYPQNVKFFLESYKDATFDPFSYLLVDLTQCTPDFLRLRANIFSRHPIVYTEKT